MTTLVSCIMFVTKSAYTNSVRLRSFVLLTLRAEEQSHALTMYPVPGCLQPVALFSRWQCSSAWTWRVLHGVDTDLHCGWS